MGIGKLVLLAFGLSMDAFAVSVCKGFASGRISLRNSLLCGAWFGGFQMLMPLLGFCLGTLFTDAIQAVDHWIAFGLLSFIGINMLREAFSDDPEDAEKADDFSPFSMLLVALATSIDAMAAGISLAMAGSVSIWLAVILTGIITFVCSAMGVTVGTVFGSRFEQKAEICGGVILILLGLSILLEDLGVML